ncbi:hypothetical protein BDU57DRAFT_76967 [Ampelomyces quisqualis]|uniref:Uncharacterized protein n=1 Tax=Ampelomyces quisqualis TaxID=50730 RepID=A0A6A5QCN7_AMPQU|nr:hypothetical protein BDU57DRAFT_76967 [Ampelomyces quisqualis]
MRPSFPRHGVRSPSLLPRTFARTTAASRATQALKTHLPLFSGAPSVHRHVPGPLMPCQWRSLNSVVGVPRIGRPARIAVPEQVVSASRVLWETLRVLDDKALSGLRDLSGPVCSKVLVPCEMNVTDEMKSSRKSSPTSGRRATRRCISSPLRNFSSMSSMSRSRTSCISPSRPAFREGMSLIRTSAGTLRRSRTYKCSCIRRWRRTSSCPRRLSRFSSVWRCLRPRRRSRFAGRQRSIGGFGTSGDTRMRWLARQ